jgi:ankyrin repeat protein
MECTNKKIERRMRLLWLLLVLLFAIGSLLVIAIVRQISADAIVEASYRGDLADVVKLVNNGVSVNAQFEDGTTPLMAASWNGHLPIVEFLLSKGADARIRNQFNDTALRAC